MSNRRPTLSRRLGRTLAAPQVIIALCWATGCLSDSVTYSHAQDADAMAVIASSWATTDGTDITVSLCEDLTAPIEANDCQEQHLVRGNGQGREHTETSGGGCGGCPLRVVAYVTGTVDGEGRQDQQVSGRIYLQSGYDDDPYAFPYTVELTCTDPAAPCTVAGTINADGSMNLTFDGAPGGTEEGGAIEGYAFTRTGAAICVPAS